MRDKPNTCGEVNTVAEQDRQKWDAKYLENIGNSDPSEILKKYASLAPRGRALDIACGNGRNSRFLAENGFQVDAVDISRVALDRLDGKDSRINVLCRDMDSWQIPENRYQLVISIRFTDRRLFPMIQKSLTPGGVLMFETFIDTDKPYCLEPGELPDAFASFRVVLYEERENEPGGRFDRSAYFVAVKKE